MAAPKAITTAQLLRQIGTPDCPVLLDLSIDEDFDAAPRLIPTSIRHDHRAMSELVTSLAGQAVVTICEGGKKISQGAAALLRSHGLQAEYLEGGKYAWRDIGAPSIPATAFKGTDRWVTRHRPKIDRIACPWLIRRFIAPDARFMFVEPGEVSAVADRFGATPFDVIGAPFAHKGSLCTFDALLDHFGLRTAPLDRMASIIRAADTNQHQHAPEAAGLLAISVGLSRQFKDDLAQMDAGMALYDALYRWARDGQDEGHSHAELET